jgi:hypothetical protein
MIDNHQLTETKNKRKNVQREIAIYHETKKYVQTHLHKPSKKHNKHKHPKAEPEWMATYFKIYIVKLQAT